MLWWQVDMLSRAVHMEVHASLGNYRVADASFEEDDKYRWILDLKEGETRSLVELCFKWYHRREDKKFPGCVLLPERPGFPMVALLALSGPVLKFCDSWLGLC